MMRTPNIPNHKLNFEELKFMAQEILNKSNTFFKSNNLLDKGQGTKSPIQDPNIQEALQAIEGLNLKVEMCGSWIWIFNADDSHEANLRAVNFKWSYHKGGWYLCPKNNKPYLRYKRPPMKKVREKYGSKFLQV